jgi:hypothetical protein
MAASAFGRRSRPMAGEDSETRPVIICQKYSGLVFIEDQAQNEMMV